MTIRDLHKEKVSIEDALNIGKTVTTQSEKLRKLCHLFSATLKAHVDNGEKAILHIAAAHRSLASRCGTSVAKGIQGLDDDGPGALLEALQDVGTMMLILQISQDTLVDELTDDRTLTPHWDRVSKRIENGFDSVREQVYKRSLESADISKDEKDGH